MRFIAKLLDSRLAIHRKSLVSIGNHLLHHSIRLIDLLKLLKSHILYQGFTNVFLELFDMVKRVCIEYLTDISLVGICKLSVLFDKSVKRPLRLQRANALSFSLEHVRKFIFDLVHLGTKLLALFLVFRYRIVVGMVFLIKSHILIHSGSLGVGVLRTYSRKQKLVIRSKKHIGYVKRTSYYA